MNWPRSMSMLPLVSCWAERPCDCPLYTLAWDVPVARLSMFWSWPSGWVEWLMWSLSRHDTSPSPWRETRGA